MAITVVTDFPSASSVRIWTFVNKNEVNDNGYVDPTAITISVFDPDSTTKVEDAEMTKSVTGIYYYDYHTGATSDAMATGRWRGTVKIIEGTGASAHVIPDNFSFKVK